MSDNENKKNLADLLEEYFPGAGKEAEQVLRDRFGGFPEEETEAVSEEIISLDGSEADDMEEVPDEPFEVPEEVEETETAQSAAELSTLSEWSDWADETIAANAAASETFGGTETVIADGEDVPEETETDTADGENVTEETETETADEESVPEETEAETADGEDVSEETETETADEESVPEETEAETADGEDVSEETETETFEDEAENTAEEVPQKEISDSSEKNEITEDEDINEKWLVRFAKGIFPVKGDGVFEVIRKVIFLAAITVFVGAGIMLASTLIQSQKAQEIQSSMHDLIVTTVASYIGTDGSIVTIPPTPDEIAAHIDEVKKNIKEINKDYIGFIEVAGCDIYEPVVKGEDNDYYLRNNIYGEQNKAGTVFMDYRCTVTPEYTSPNLVIYGHNQEDGTMFGRLKYYKVDYTQSDFNANFYKNNPVIKFSSEFENNEYLIYGFFVTNALENQDSNGIVFHYHDYIETMNDENTFNWYQGEVRKRNQIISPVDVQYGDKLLVLSTCSNEFTNSRFVVFARKLREGESVSDYDFSETRLNPNAQGVDWTAILSGETSATEVPEQEEILDESTTHKKSLNKRNEKTYTTADEEEQTVTAAPAETTAVTTTVPVSETSETKTETAGSAEGDESSESDVTEAGEGGSESDTDGQTDENGETVPETDENGETVTYSDSETSESDTETTTKKKTTEASESSEVVTSKKNSNKSNK